MNGEYVIKMGHVESVEDDADGLRIKVRTALDRTETTAELPYAFPLLSKAFRSVPKVGEGALVIMSELGNPRSNRYYIGPISPQDQYNDFAPYDYGRGVAVSTLQGGDFPPLAKLSNIEETRGSYPNVNDVAVVGRKSEDIILKEGEIDLRCGIRSKPVDKSNKDVVGEVVFNTVDPAYIQMKYDKAVGYSKDQECNSIINICADKINIIGRSSNPNRGENLIQSVDNKELIKTSEIDGLMKQLHQLPYGDKLCDVLLDIIYALLTHVHAFPGEPPDQSTEIKQVQSDINVYDLILSKNVRIS